MSSTVKLAEYLFKRLRQLGAEAVHGVPGDYNLTLLDYVEPAGLLWVGNCNELNAGYAADAYGRIKGLGVLVTTFGVGELSAVNAIAGAYTEFAPLVHIVGTPARQAQESRALIHHTYNDGEYHRFAKIAAEVTVAQVDLLDPRTSPQLIDATIQQCLIHSRPVYIQVPVDMVSVPVSSENLGTPVKLPSSVPSSEEQTALTAVLDRIYASKQPVIFVDGEAKPYGILDDVDNLVRQSNWPTWTSVFGKSLVDETLHNVNGVWKGNYAVSSHNDYINSADLVLCFGPHFCSTNSYAQTAIPKKERTIFFNATSIEINDKKYRDLPAKDFVSKLIQKCDFSRLSKPPANASSLKPQPHRPSLASDSLVDTEHFYHVISDYFRSGDIILAETGTAGWGSRDFRLPRHTHHIKPSTWLSIGYMLPAAQGASLAQRELHAVGKWKQEGNESNPRTVLFIGDGSFQMTVQEVSTIVRHKLNVTIWLINNDGYTIERAIHGYKQGYNDVARWRYLQAGSFFGANVSGNGDYISETYEVRTWGDLNQTMETLKTAKPGFRMVEVFMDREDCREMLQDMLQTQKKTPTELNVGT